MSHEDWIIFAIDNGLAFDRHELGAWRREREKVVPIREERGVNGFDFAFYRLVAGQMTPAELKQAQALGAQAERGNAKAARELKALANRVFRECREQPDLFTDEEGA